MARGRVTTYTDEIAKEICSRIANGESLRSICQDDHMPSKSTVMLWLVDGEHKYLSDQYAEARRIQAEALADELFDIADNGKNDWMERNGEGNPGYTLNGEHVQRSRLRLDTRKWYLSKVLPKFADKQQIEHTGKLDLSTASDDEINRKLNELIALVKTAEN